MSNLRNLQALAFATGEFSFAPDATSADNAADIGFTDFGNIVSVSINPETEKVEHKGSYRGIRRTDRTVISETKLEYRIKCDELDREKLLYALLGTVDTNHSQPSLISGILGETLPFSTTPAVINRWYDLRDDNGGRVRSLTAVDFSTSATEGTDYELDLKLGRVRFLTDQNTDLTPNLTAPAITATDGMKGIAPLTNTVRRGYGRLSLFDDGHPDKVIYDHVDFSCEVSFEGMNELDGQNFGEIDLNVLVTSDAGKVYTAE